MNLYVLLKMVPDTVEELNVAADGKSLDSEFLRFKLSEPDDHALEQALILKEKHGGKVTVVALDAPEVDDVLFTALAKGADRAVKIPINQAGLGTTASAKVLTDFLSAGGPIAPDTLLLPGSQAIDDLEGEVAPLLAAALNLPFIGVVCGVKAADGKATVMKEFAGGLRAEFEVALPAVLGIQSAEKPPRYEPVAKVRAVMKSAKIEEADIPAPERPIQLDIERMYKPEAAGHAEMFEGAPEEVADKLVEVLAKAGAI
jgi:electron transfer flavoprotein beta subunit